MARIRAALRRVPSAQTPLKKIRLGQIVIDFEERTVIKESVSIHLTPKELDLLRYL
jgi:DNA-binding response OmpR family regulator